MRVICLAAIPIGVATTMLGPLMPEFEARWGLDDARGGLLFVAQFLAIFAAASTVGVLAARLGYWRLMAIGMLIGALGVAGSDTRSWTMAWISVAVYGCGLGMAIPAANLAVAAASPGASAPAVLWMNFFWSVGAVTAPLLVASLRRAFLPSLAAGLLAMAVWIAAARPADGAAPVASTAVRTRRPHLLSGLMLFLYVGSEASIAGWVSSYAIRSAAERQLWAVLPSVFWGSILTGRLVSPGILRRVPSGTLAPWGIACGLAGAALLLAGGGPLAMLAGSSICGLGFAPIYPLVVASYADRTGGGSLSGLVFAAGSLGGAAVPALVGWTSTVSGSLRTGLAAILVLIVAMLGLTRSVMPRSDRFA